MTEPTPSCAAAAREHGEPLAGTAAFATTWIFLEERGSWAPKALASGGLDSLRQTIQGWLTSAPNTRLQLIRRPRTADGAKGRQVFVAVATGAAFDVRGERFTDASLTNLHLNALREACTPSEDPVEFICAHGKRDRCCALYGVALYKALAGAAGEQWMTSHLGGHRFAPTLLHLPSGFCYGHLNADEPRARPATSLRGRVCYPQDVQAAELLLLAERAENVRFMGRSEDGRMHFQANGEDVWLRGEQPRAALPRPLSCNDEPKAPPTWHVSRVTP
ncbi:MAG: sucrase ferredoxin [Myxococcota bacterium]